MNRTQLINMLLLETASRKYLEIGVSAGDNFRNIESNYKIGVDPNPQSPATHTMTSDEFFSSNKEKFDVIFVDGLHYADQVYTDIMNALSCLNDGGYVVAHDMNPRSELAQMVPFINGHWNGDGWKAFVKISAEEEYVDCYVVDTDEGCAVFKRTNQQTTVGPCIAPVDIASLNYSQHLAFDRESMLRLTPANKIINDRLEPLLNEFIFAPDNEHLNWQLARFYHALGQYAAAVGYYIRCAERTDDSLVQYECLVRAAMCFEAQTIRKFSVKGMLQHAISLHPERPEAYYLLCKITSNEQNDGNWFDSYTWASLGVRAADNKVPQLKTVVDYPGKIAIEIQRAHAAWWCGMCDLSRELFLELNERPLQKEYKKLVMANLRQFNGFRSNKLELYTSNQKDKLRIQFPGLDTIKQNFSESYQDMFVLSMLNGKTHGTYIEIGAGDPYFGNNTALLEKEFNWTGISLDINPDIVNNYNKQRSHRCILRDSTLVEFNSFLSGLGFESNIDYLQLDCDPPAVTYRTLLSIPFDTFKFAVITYEHDYYADEEQKYRELSRQFLTSYGYVLVAGNIAPDYKKPYEDWWVHPDLVNVDILNKMRQTDDATKKASDYMLGRL